MASDVELKTRERIALVSNSVEGLCEIMDCDVEKHSAVWEV